MRTGCPKGTMRGASKNLMWGALNHLRGASENHSMGSSEHGGPSRHPRWGSPEAPNRVLYLGQREGPYKVL